MSTKIYQVKPNSGAGYGWLNKCINNDTVSKVGKEIERLQEQNDGALTRERVVEAAKKQSSPLHEFFEWSDTEAANAYRLEQASALMRSYNVVIVTPEKQMPVRANVSIKTPSGQRVYAPTHTVMNDEDLSAMALQDALSYLRSAQIKLKKFQELSVACGYVDCAILKVEKHIIKHGGTVPRKAVSA